MTKSIVAILLDETGSMAPNAVATVSAVNELIRSFRNGPDAADIDIYLTRFNSNMLTVKDWPAKDCPDVTDYKPTSMTPLYDAIGRTIKLIDDKSDAGAKVAFIIQTDGQENSSVEYAVDTIKGLIDERKAKGWDFTFIGADFSQFQANSFANLTGVSLGRSAGYSSANVSATMKGMADSTRSYLSGARMANADLSQDELDNMVQPKAAPQPAATAPRTRSPRTQGRWPTA